MKMCSRSCCQPLALHQRQQDRDRERKRHESETREWRRARACVTGHLACVRRQMFLVWRGRGERTRALLRLLLQSPPGMNKQMCREAALACWDSQSSSSVSLLIFSPLLSFQSASSSPLPLLIRPHKSSRVAHTHLSDAPFHCIR